MAIIKDIIADEERAFYASKNDTFVNIKITGVADGESSFKECQDVVVQDSYFNLRYPFWHNEKVVLNNIEMTSNCRAALWYSNNITLLNSQLDGIKVFRECQNINVKDTVINSPEPFWFCDDIKITNGSIKGEYAFLQSSNIEIHNLHFSGKYSFQYVKNLKIYDSILDTKDAFWHAENVEVYNSVVKGEYLAWYAKRIKLVNCKIIGTQPICYSDDIVLENCTMENTDCSFEYSTVDAKIKGNIMSIKNPYKGNIIADSIDEIIIDEFVKQDSDVIINGKKVA